MPMIRVRRPADIYQFNTDDGTMMVDGPRLVAIACDDGWGESELDKLKHIVGRLLERLPASEWLDIIDCYGIEEVK